MKKNFLSKLLASSLIISSILFGGIATNYTHNCKTIYAQETTNVSANGKIAMPERVSVNAKISSIQKNESGQIISVVAIDENGFSIKYNLTNDTLITSAVTGENRNADILNIGTSYYFICDAIFSEDDNASTNVQAIITSVPQYAHCPTLHNIDSIEVVEDNYILELDYIVNGKKATIVLDPEGHMSIFQLGDVMPLVIEKDRIQQNDRLLVWSAVTTVESRFETEGFYPYQAMVIQGAKEGVDNSLAPILPEPIEVFVDTPVEVPVDVVEETVTETVEEEIDTNFGTPLPEIPQELLDKLFGAVTYGYEPTSIHTSSIMAVESPRIVNYESVSSIVRNDKGVVEFFSSTNSKGVTTQYTVDENTLIIDGNSGKTTNLLNLQSNDKIYVYGNSNQPLLDEPINYAQGIVLNLGANANVPQLFKVIDVDSGTSGETIIYVDDPDIKSVSMSNNTLVTAYVDGDVLGRSNIAINNRVFIWENKNDSVDGKISSSKIVVAPTLDEDLEMIVEGALSLPALVKDGRAFVSLRTVAEGFGLEVNWNPTNKVTTISSESRSMTIAIGQSTYTTQPDKLGNTSEVELGASFIGDDGILYIDPLIFEVFGGYIVNMKTPSN